MGDDETIIVAAKESSSSREGSCGKQRKGWSMRWRALGKFTEGYFLSSLLAEWLLLEGNAWNGDNVSGGSEICKYLKQKRIMGCRERRILARKESHQQWELNPITRQSKQRKRIFFI